MNRSQVHNLTLGNQSQEQLHYIRASESARSSRNTSAKRKHSGVNYGERLYQRGVKKREEKQLQAEQERQSRERKELESATFKPQINEKGYSRTEATEDLLI